jgi:flagellar assembly protein FliH
MKVLSSKLLKANNIISKNEAKVVKVPFEHTENQDYPQEFVEMQQPVDPSVVEAELALLREQTQVELEDWKKREQEHFLLQLEEEKRRGYNDGYQMGMDEGSQHGLLKYQELLEKAGQILEQSYQEKNAIIREAEPFVIELSVEMAKKVLQQELKGNQEALIQLIKECLSSVYESASLTIAVAPDDYPFVQKQREQLLAVVNGQVEVKILPDYTIQQGGCIIRTSSGSVDARIDVQLTEIKKALLSYQQELEIT